MAPSADLFVVCKQCGSEVSPYITECPYCGARLRRRAPKLPRDGEEPRRRRHRHRRRVATLGRLRPGEIPGIRAESRPYVTIAIVLATAGVWIAWRGFYVNFSDLVIAGPLRGHWWRLITSQFAYANGVYQFVDLVAIGLFGWLLERRHGPLLVLTLFFACGITGALAEVAAYSDPLLSGANAAALGLVAAWAAHDLLARRRGDYYDGDLLGAAAFAAVLLAMPAARLESGILATGVGGLIGLVLGAGLAQLEAA